MTLVYQPSEDSYLLESVIKKYSSAKSVLDMCTGTGILARKALKNAREVTAVDINSSALNGIKDKRIKIIKSNLFRNIKSKFDLIICNPPYLPYDKREDKQSSLATSGGIAGDEFILKFISQAKKHLEKNGIILLLVSSLTPRNRINNLLFMLNLKSKVVAEKSIFFEKLEVLEIKYR